MKGWAKTIGLMFGGAIAWAVLMQALGLSGFAAGFLGAFPVGIGAMAIALDRDWI